MKTTGVLPEELAASISLLSRSEMDPMPNSLRLGESQPGSLTSEVATACRPYGEAVEIR